MRDFMVVLIECSVSMSVLALGFIVMTPLLSKRYSSKGLYYAWLVVVAGLIIPFRLHLNTALIQMSSNPFYVQNIMPENTPGDAEAAIQAVAHQGVPAIPWYQFVGCLWIAGTVAYLVYHGLRHYRFIRMVTRWGEQANNPQVHKTLEKMKNDIGITKQVKLQICPCVSSPMMIGFFDPVILLPGYDFSEDGLTYILRHELVHFKRKDLWYKSLVILATAIHWFNPVVYLAAKAIAFQCEISCDAEVVNETDMAGRQQYSETILGVIKNQARVQTAFSTNFYRGRKGLKKRIFSIMDNTKKKAGAALLCLILIGTLGSGMAFAANKNGTSYAYSTNTPLPLQEQERLIQQNRETTAEQYAIYEKYGLSYELKTDSFYYKGKLVRFFSDKLNSSDTYNSFTRANGVLDLKAVRNATYELTGIVSVSQDEYNKHTESIKRAQAAVTQGTIQENGSGNTIGGSTSAVEDGGTDDTGR